MGTPQLKNNTSGFTIVELLIVIVVIAILAAITIVAYNGIQNRAKRSALQSDLTNSAKKLEIYKYTPGNDEQYPNDLSTAGVTNTNLAYSRSGTNYCLVAVNGTESYYVSNTSSKPQQGACVVTDQLVGWWGLNNSATDISGNSLNGTASSGGPTAITGQNGQANSAYQFNGANFLTLPSSTLLNPTNNFSVSAWVRLNSDIGTSTWNDILAGTAADWGVGINVDAAGIGYLMITKINNADAPRSTTAVTKQEWKHLAVSFSNNTINYYLDGQPNGTVTAASAFGTFTASAKRIGSRGTMNGNFRGALDDVRLYNKVLSSPEVTAIYNGGAQ